MDLRELVGKREELASLRTKDPAEARVRYAKLAAEVEERWANLRAGPSELSEREAHALAASCHDRWLQLHYDEPSFQCGWQTGLYPTLWTAAPLPEIEAQPGVYGERPITNILHDSMRRWCMGKADEILAEHGLVVDEWSRWKLAKAVGAALQRASLILGRAAEGEIALDDPSLPNSPPAAGRQTGAPPPPPSPSLPPATEPSLAKPASLTALFEAWWLEAKAAGRKPSTRENYSNTVENFVSFLKHDDATKVTPEHVVAFKDYRLSTPSKHTGRPPSAKTVKDTDLAALKTVFGWAVANRRLATNPATGVTVRVGKTQKLRSKGFTDQEARLILTAALAYVPSAERACTAAAKRWVPWLCAFTGARVGEIGQLRRQDVSHEGEWWVIRITPEAGTVKTDEAREVVVHPQLVELGFLDFVARSDIGPLFLLPAKNGDILGPLQGLKNRLAEFSRALVTDPNVAPNHGWRHRFKTVGMEAGIETRVLNAIQGHTGQTVSDRYGEVTIRTQAVAIQKLPRIDVGA